MHRSRLLTLISSPVSDMLKPAYAFGGLPMIQKAKPYIDNFLSTRQNVHDAVRHFSIYVLMTNMGEPLGGKRPRTSRTRPCLWAVSTGCRRSRKSKSRR
jgi:uncharacterized protein